MTWKDFLKQKGFETIAKEMNTTYESVRRWHVGLASPSRYLKPLCEYAHKELSSAEFIEFMNSLSVDLTGFGTV